jgi:hypothetical protein
MLNDLTFKREDLAKAYCDSLQGKGIVEATSGLFLAAPRRVGKSTFLIEDLIPEARSRGWLTVYVDFWADKQADPALLITEAVKLSIAAHRRKLSQLIKHIQLQKVNILKTVELDFSKPGLPENITLVDLFSDLIRLCNQSVLLIIDEAQHALTTSNGVNAMFSIKSARDQINLSHQTPRFFLVLTGSNRDKLAQLVVKKDQPFFGSEVTAFPLLGRDYTDFFAEKINASLATDNQFSQDSLWEAFQLTGHRPEILRQMVGRVAISHEAQSFSDLLKRDASIWCDQIWEEFDRDFNALSVLQQTILTLVIQQNGRLWSPFSEESMQYYRQAIDDPALSISSVQTAIQSLREHGFIWQSSRGMYALEDDSLLEWFQHRRNMV